MPIRVQLTDDKILRLNVDPDEWKRAFENALANDEVVQVRNDQGEVLSIVPGQVQYWAPAPAEIQEEDAAFA